MQKTYEYILFDWDGCLAKTLDVVLDAYKTVFAEYGIYPEDKTITSEVFGDWNGPTKLGVTDIDAYTKKWLDILDEYYPQVKLYEGAKETLLALKKRNKKLALVTTGKIATVKPALVNNNVLDIFDLILSAEDVKKHKPDPEIIETAIARLQGNTESTIIIGDSKSDLGAAKNAGIDSILFYPEHNHKFYDLDTLRTYNPNYIVKDFKKILELV